MVKSAQLFIIAVTAIWRFTNFHLCGKMAAEKGAGKIFMSQKQSRMIFIIISAIGILNGLYLTVLKLTNNKNLCIQGVGDCWSVNTSIYSQVFGIPVALLGTLAFVSLLVIAFLESRLDILKNYGSYFLFGITLVGVLYSAYLTYLEIAVIQAICPFCILSAISMLILFFLSVTRLVKNQP